MTATVRPVTKSKKPTKKSVKKDATKKTSASRKATQAAIAAAAKSVVSKPPEPDEPPIEGTPDQRREATSRAEKCSHAVDEVLTRFRCRIVPVLNPTIEMIGGGPTEPANKGVVSCTYGVAPLV